MKTFSELQNIYKLGGEKSAGNLIRVILSHERFTSLVTDLVKNEGLPLSLLCATDEREETGSFWIHAVLSLSHTHERLIISSATSQLDSSYESLTKTIMAAHWYERYLMDQFGIIAKGHPDPRRLVHHEQMPEGIFPLRKDFAWSTKIAHADIPYPMHHVEGEGIYEIPVGPIHAGIIEPGHFRFNVAGERIVTLEGKLFFTHKGVEKMLEGKTPEEALPFIERLSGDASASHALAFCQAVENIAIVQEVPERALFLRSLFCELERVTMHIHDLANIAGMGTGYTMMAAQGFRIKERLMRLSDRLIGNRFWRGVIIPGGCSMNFSEGQLHDLQKTVSEVITEMRSLIEVGLCSSGLRERLETTGILSREAAIAYGAVGLPARASGLDVDIRRDYPYAAYPHLPVRVVIKNSGDVFARFLSRADELTISMEIISSIIEQIKQGPIYASIHPVSGLALGSVESWRGEILTFLTMKDGRITRCFPRDPSFCNWSLFGEIGPGNIVPDFPLCNKSLNLSYSGNDL